MSDMDRDFWNEAYKEDAGQVVITDYFLEAEIENLSPGRALDLGCGSGPNALMLARRGWSVVGVDWAEHAIKLARETAQREGLAASFVVGDVTNWTTADLFNLVINTYALPGGRANERVLQTAVAALAPGGTLIVAEWDKSMTQAWGFDEADLPSPEEIVALLPGLVIETAEVRQVPDAHGSGTPANVAFVRAQKV